MRLSINGCTNADAFNKCKNIEIISKLIHPNFSVGSLDDAIILFLVVIVNNSNYERNRWLISG